ncbi:hypothetical protein Scep_027620 [Stephania cephalantha]|uniref:FYVE-type domain-containing protein n=1 Tax=Stephania cephalantha TaxID=152367 RepID=A0AAP0EFS6_9MAGN
MSSSSRPPAFQEASRCEVCKCSFNTFRRRHHCRCCGKTLCHEHSSSQMALPQFGIHSSVRVCSDCFNNPSWPEKDSPQVSGDYIISATDTFSKMDVGGDIETKVEQDDGEQKPQESVLECTCGMPLCICVAPAPNPTTLQMQSASNFTSPPNPRPKKLNHLLKNVNSTSTSKTGSYFNAGNATNGSLHNPTIEYDVNGEGLREAIKNGDTTAVKKLLSEGVDANYCDKQGLSLLHLAAVFNQTEIAFLLMDNGAKLDCKNAQGETPIDCAPTMLQYKMKKKIEGSA